MSWLLDTCALSEYAKKAPALEVIAWLDEQDEASLHISVITVGELRRGIVRLEPSRRRDDLDLPNRFDVYYGMADSRIGVARLDLPEPFLKQQPKDIHT